MHLQVHDDIDIKHCLSSSEKTGKCKETFRDVFSKALVEQYAHIVGCKNKHDEFYWRGDEAYKETRGEDYFYTAYEMIRHSKSDYIGDFFIK